MEICFPLAFKRKKMNRACSIYVYLKQTPKSYQIFHALILFSIKKVIYKYHLVS
jgi:hypothetical protein